MRAGPETEGGGVSGRQRRSETPGVIASFAGSGAGLDEGSDIAVAALADIGFAAVSDLYAGRNVAVAVLGQDGRVIGAELADAGCVAIAVLIGSAIVVMAFLPDGRQIVATILAATSRL